MLCASLHPSREHAFVNGDSVTAPYKYSQKRRKDSRLIVITRIYSIGSARCVYDASAFTPAADVANMATVCPLTAPLRRQYLYVL
jgi:hypothetical protein